MIFKERQKRAMDTMNHRNREYLEKMNDASLNEDGEDGLERPHKPQEDNPLSKDNLEKGDLTAMVISALLTFLPIILVIALIMFISVKLLLS